MRTFVATLSRTARRHGRRADDRRDRERALAVDLDAGSSGALDGWVNASRPASD
jgi:hypothetical protein